MYNILLYSFVLSTILVAILMSFLNKLLLIFNILLMIEKYNYINYSIKFNERKIIKRHLDTVTMSTASLHPSPISYMCFPLKYTTPSNFQIY